MTDSDGFGITVCNCPEVITSEVNGTVHIVCGGKIMDIKKVKKKAGRTK